MGSHLGLIMQMWNSRYTWIHLGILSASLYSCKETPPEDWRTPGPQLASSGAPQAEAPDRLPPGKLLEGSEAAFGFKAPQGMQVVRARRNAQVIGRVDFDELTKYVKDRILVRHAEMRGKELVFAHAKIRGAGDGIFTFTISAQGKRSMVNIQSEAKEPGTHGLSEAQRWKRAGMKPNGGLIDPNAME